MTADLLGTDLVVAPFLVAHDAAEIDLSTTTRPARGLLAPSALEAFDLAVIHGRQNLAHALLLRLLTPLGSLAALGHSGYGSRLHELIGQRKSTVTRNLCRLFVLEVVRQEPRVDDAAAALVFETDEETPSSFAFRLEVRPVDGGDPVALGLEVGL